MFRFSEADKFGKKRLMLTPSLPPLPLPPPPLPSSTPPPKEILISLLQDVVEIIVENARG